VFLGFHFHQQNMDLLQPHGVGGAVHVYATVFDRHAPEVDVIGNQIVTMLRPERQTHIKLEDLKCVELLNHFGTTLLR
jgi:hypothetical protein